MIALQAPPSLAHFKPPQFVFAYAPAALPILPMIPDNDIRQHASPIEAAWAAATWTDYEHVPPEDLRREAKQIVDRLDGAARQYFSRSLPVPTFSSTAAGSVDVHWGDGEDCELLLAFAASGGVASFFGRNPAAGTHIRGVIRTDEPNDFLAAWLLEHRGG